MSELDKRILDGLTGDEKIRALLRTKGFGTYREYGISRGFSISELSLCFRGSRPYPEIRDALATDLELDRDEIDHLIDGPPSPVAEVA